MYKIGAVMLLLWLAGCREKGEKKEEKSEQVVAAGYRLFSARFKKAALPYGLSETALLSNADTAGIRDPQFLALIPDSLQQALFGKGSKVKYVPLARVDEASGDKYLVVKGVSGKESSALIMAFNPAGQFGAVLPFLRPDDDPDTQQLSLIDKSYSITRSITRRIPDEPSVEGKDVYIYNRDAKAFTLIMTDILDNDAIALINPIDTLSRNHRFAGDYTKDKSNIVSIRDARNIAEFNFFIHIEKGEDCTGELKGTALMTSSKTAVFRQGGNPCVMEFSFSGSSVTIKEAEGCGSQRSIGCTMDGTFAKKKAAKATAGKENAKGKA